MTAYIAEIIAAGGRAEHQLRLLEQNVPALEAELRLYGVQLEYKAPAGEGHAALKAALVRALDRSDIIFITGGVGMLAEDDTIEYVSRALGFRVERREEEMRRITRMMRERGVEMRAEFEHAACLPVGGVAMANDSGIAPGCYLSAGKQCIFIMPSRPMEFEEMLRGQVKSLLSEFCGGVSVTRTVRCFGLSAAELGENISDFLGGGNPSVKIEGSGCDLVMKVTAAADTRQNAMQSITALIKKLIDRVGSHIYAVDADSLQQVLTEQMKAKKLTLGLAEAGTRGAVMSLLSGEEGAWELIRFNFSSTSSRAKEERLGLSERFLRRCEPVSEQMSAAMARAAQKNGGASLGAAIACETVSSDSIPSGNLQAFCSVCDGENVWTKRVSVDTDGMSVDAVRILLAQHLLDLVRRVAMAYPEKMAGAADVDSVVAGVASGLAAGFAAVSRPNERGRFAVEEQEPARSASIRDEQPPQRDSRAEEYSASWQELDGEAQYTQYQRSVQPPKETQAPQVKRYDPNADSASAASEKKKKKGFFARIFPCKGDTKGEVARKLVFLVAICVFVGAMAYLLNYYLQGSNNKKLISSLSEMYTLGELGEVEIPEDYPDDYQLKFAALYAANPDVAGYIEIKDTILSYPVVQAADNDYYLRRNFLGESSQYGVPFVDYEVDLKEESTNTLIYGHNMHDNQMFGELMEYKNINYYREHPVITFNSIYRDGEYKIIAMFLANVKESDGPVFQYQMFIDGGYDATEKYIAECRRRSLITIQDDVNGNDKLLTLSTCSYEFTDARFVVVARKLRDGESADVDTSSAVYNEDPLMPERWYQLYDKNRVQDSGAAPQGSIPAASQSGHSSQSSQSESHSSLPESSSQSSIEESSVSESSSEERPSHSEASSTPEQSSSHSESSSAPEQPSHSESSSAPEQPSHSEASSAPEQSSHSESSSTPEQPSQTEQENLLTNTARPSLSVSGTGGQSSLSSSSSSSSSPSAETQETYNVNGSSYTALEAVSRMVMSEIGGNFNEEAIKAQAVACYTYLKYHGTTITGVGLRAPTTRVTNLVSEVLGEYIADDLSGRPIPVTYYAISAGVSNPSNMVWGGYVRNLVSVDSWIDVNAPGYETTLTLTADEVRSMLESNLGASFDGIDKQNWFEIVSYTTADDLYVNRIKVGNISTTGRMMREKGLVQNSRMLLRSAAFSVEYSAATDKFTFTVKGYGHGVGLSQYGANLYAAQGKSYEWILKHYFSNVNIVKG